MKKQTFTATGFSQEIGVHPGTILKWIRSGKLQAHKNAANHWEIPASEVDRIKGQITQKERGPEEAEAAFRSLEVRWRQGLVDRMTELLIAAQRYRMDMWKWKQEEDPIHQQEILNRVLSRSFPELLNEAAKAKQWRDFAELGTEMLRDGQPRPVRKKAIP